MNGDSLIGVLYFTIYAFGGWVLESVYASIRYHRLVNRGFLYGTFCPVYGFSALLIIHAADWTKANFASPLMGGLILVVLSALLITMLEYITGWILDHAFGRRWWDYSGNRWNLGGYVCLEYSLLWGGIAYLLIEVLHPAVSIGLALLPDRLITGAALAALLYFAVDAVLSAGKEWSRKFSAQKIQDFADDAEYYACVADLLSHGQIRRMDSFIQHGHTTCLQHSTAVSYLSYKLCRRWNLDYHSAARGGLMHDLFLYDWHEPERGRGWHGFTHPKTALNNAEACFTLNPIEADIIVKHMWPLTPGLPAYRESWVICIADKYVTLIEFWNGRTGIRMKTKVLNKLHQISHYGRG